MRRRGEKKTVSYVLLSILFLSTFLADEADLHRWIEKLNEALLILFAKDTNWDSVTVGLNTVILVKQENSPIAITISHPVLYSPPQFFRRVHRGHPLNSSLRKRWHLHVRYFTSGDTKCLKRYFVCKRVVHVREKRKLWKSWSECIYLKIETQESQ